MIHAKYYKDYGRNYLIIGSEDDTQSNAYQIRMITRNQIKGLLPCQERHINGETLLYYEISSRQSMQHIFGERKMDRMELCSFFMQLKVVNDLLKKYLLSGNDILLQPEFIYKRIETGEYEFVYYAEYKKSSLQVLTDFLIDVIDNEDTVAVETVYRIADLIQRDKFAMEEILSWFPEEPKTIKTQERRQENPIIQEDTLTHAEQFLDKSSEKNFEKNFIKKKEAFCLKDWFRKIFFSSPKEKKNCSGEERKYVQTEEGEEKVEEKAIGNTVFIPWTEGCENKLYGINKGNKYHIDLSKLPLSVGKLAGAVDLVIGEQSISRMHAKFFREGSSIYIRDLNSTNGTFRNGMRLEPNTSEIIEPGDEIRLGKLNFIYR